MVKRVLLALSLLAAAQAEADPFWVNMQETDDLRLLYFHPLTTHLVPHVTRSFQNSLDFQRDIFRWTPYEKTTLMLNDWVDYGNAKAMVTRSNVVEIDVAPLNHTFETFPAVERVYMLMNHELVHLATGDAANSSDLRWRRFFGGKPFPLDKHPETFLYHYLSTPRNVAPRWFFEGTAVFMETWMAGGIGRAQGAYDEMKFRSLVRDNQPFYSNLGLVAEGTAADFQTTTNAYFYGTRFISYLAYTYSPEQVIEWMRRDEDSERYYASQFRRVFDKSLEEAWDDWIAFENGFQQENLASIREFPVTPATPIVDSPLGSVSRTYVDSRANVLIGGYYYPGVVGHLGVLSLEDGTTRRLTDIKAPMKYRVTSLAYDPDQQVLFYTTDNLDLRDLMSIPLAGGKERMLMEDARIGDLAFNRADQSLWGVRTESAYVSLVRINAPYDSWETIHSLPYGQVLADLDVSPDGKLLSAAVEQVDGSQALCLFRIEDLLDGRFEPVGRFDFGRAVPESFVFSPDGRYLFGSTYYTGVSNIFRYVVATGDIEAVSNAETGFFLPVPMEDGSLIVWEYTGQGLVPKRIEPVPLEEVGAITFLGNEIAQKHPVVTEWAVGSPMKVDLDGLNPQDGKYYPRRELFYASGYPILEGYRDTFALGWSMQWEDPMMFNTMSADLSYSIDTNDEVAGSTRWHADIEYEALYWRFRYWHNDADFYDLFGPTERAREGDAYIAGYDKPLIFDGPRRLDGSLELAWYTGLDTLPGNQNVGVQFEELLSFYAELNYKHTQESLGAVDHEKGIRWDLKAYLDHANGDIVPKLRFGVDFGFALPIKHSSLWLYSSAGIADGDRDNPLANWYFGSFGNNYVDDREVKRYREFYGFPGFEIDQLSAQDFVKSVLEWNLPPMRFANVGIPSAFLSSARPALFAGVLLADLNDSQYREDYYTLGLQVDFSITVAHRYPLTLSVGYAQGYIDGEKGDNELMVSLKIL